MEWLVMIREGKKLTPMKNLPSFDGPGKAFSHLLNNGLIRKGTNGTAYPELGKTIFIVREDGARPQVQSDPKGERTHLEIPVRAPD